MCGLGWVGLYFVRGGVYGCWLYCLIRVGSCMCRGEHRSGRDAKFHIASHSRCGAVWYCVGVGGCGGWHEGGVGAYYDMLWIGGFTMSHHSPSQGW